MASLEELVKDKSVKEIQAMAEDLRQIIKTRQKEEEEELAKELRKGITIDTEVFFLDGNGKKAKPVKAVVTQITRAGITAMDASGKRYTRRFKKLINEDTAREYGFKGE